MYAYHKFGVTATLFKKDKFWQGPSRTIAENWDIKTPSVGTILTSYLSLFRDFGLDHVILGIRLFCFQDKKLKFFASV